MAEFKKIRIDIDDEIEDFFLDSILTVVFFQRN